MGDQKKPLPFTTTAHNGKGDFISFRNDLQKKHECPDGDLDSLGIRLPPWPDLLPSQLGGSYGMGLEILYKIACNTYPKCVDVRSSKEFEASCVAGPDIATQVAANVADVNTSAQASFIKSSSRKPADWAMIGPPKPEGS